MRASERPRRWLCTLACALLFGALLPGKACIADERSLSAPRSASELVSEFVVNWLERAERARATEPRWVSPLITVTPRLEQSLLRFDQSLQAQPRGAQQSVYGPKIKLIPAESFEVDVGAPYITLTDYRKKVRRQDHANWGDTSFLVKYRLLSANEANGDYVVSFFAGLSVPTGPKGLSTGSTVFSPTIAMGKGWGAFDIQSTLGVSVPDSGMDRLGTPLSFNTALQYRVLDKMWPELEFNYNWWPNGQRTGENSLFLTPGILFGRFPIWRTFDFTVGTGVQIALTRHRSSNLNWISSGRLAF